MGSSRSVRSARSTTSARNNGRPTDPFATPRFQPEIVSPLSFDGASQARRIRTAHSMNSTRTTRDWPEDVSANGFLAVPHGEELVSPLVWQGSLHVGDSPAGPPSLRGSVRTMTPFSSSQSVYSGTGTRPTTPVAHQSPSASVYGRDTPRTPQFPAQNMEQYRVSSRPTSPSIYSNADARSIAQSMVVPAGRGYHTPSVRSRTASNVSHSIHNHSDTHRSRKITITTTTTIDLPADFNPAIYLAPTAPPSQGLVVSPEMQRHHVDPSTGWSVSATGSLPGPGENEVAAFNAVHSEYGDCATLQGAPYARSAKGSRVRHDSHRTVGGPLGIRAPAPASPSSSRTLDRQSQLSRPDRRRSRSYSDLQDLGKYSRYALPAHESAVTVIKSRNVEADGKKPSNGPKKGGLLRQLFKM